MAVKDEDVAQLKSMGFPEQDSVEALRITGGNVEMAINHLLSGGVDAYASQSASTASIAPPSSHISSPLVGGGVASPAELSGSTDAMAAKAGGVLRGRTSQYTFADIGRSACTCIALTAAKMFLQDKNVTSDLLDRMISDGIKNYQNLTSAPASNQQIIEHMSAEEVLQKDQGRIFGIQIIGGNAGAIRQGMLSNDLGHPLGMKSMLEGIRYDYFQNRKKGLEQDDEWICVLITKTPETVLVCFPPDSVSPSSYWLIDSHPRAQLGLDTSYAKLHPSLDTLLLSLQAIFPPTELGPDIPEMMAQMYNSFDLYPLERRRN